MHFTFVKVYIVTDRGILVFFAQISDIWRSKSAATEREKHALEAELREKSQEMSRVLLSLEQTRRELQVCKILIHTEM